jgi:glycosyltransferase
VRVLVVAAGSPATVFALSPLAHALRNAGHTVFMAATEDMMGVVASAGFPGIAVTDLPIRHFITTDRAGAPVTIPADPTAQAHFTGRWFGRLAAASMPVLTGLADAWRPDVVVGGTMCYAAPLLAAELKVPFVRQAWDAIDADGIHPGADEELQPELRRLGLDRLPAPDLFVDISPPSLRPAHTDPAVAMRWIPGNAQRRLEPWMYTRGTRPRILVTSGSRVTRAPSYDQNYDFLRTLTARLRDRDAELIVAAPEDVADGIRAELGDVRAGWFPLDVVAPTCDLVVHHGGGVTSMTSLDAGVPQLIMPKGAVLVVPARRIADRGAAITLESGEDDADGVADACHALLTNPSYRAQAQALSREIRAMPPPSTVVGQIESLVA